MANEISLFSAGGLVPDYLREGADEMTRRLAGGAQGKAISIEGGVWRMIVGGEEIAKNEDRAMNMVIVNAAPHVSRVYYEGTYVKGQSSEPVCYSPDGKAPAADAAKRQSLSCATCPQNVKGSGQNDSRACRFNQRLAVVLDNDINGNVYRLQLPAKSLFGKAEGDKMPLQAYGKFLAGHGVPISGVVTEARFDTSESVPVLKFRAVRPLSREELNAARAQGASEDAKQAVEFKVFRKEPQPALPAAFSQPEPEAPAPAPAPAAAAPAPEPAKRTTKPKAEPVVTPVKDVGALLDEWGSDDA